VARRVQVACVLVACLLGRHANASGWAASEDELVWPDAIQTVVNQLASDDVVARRAAAAALGRLPESVQRRLLPTLFSDSDPEVRLVVADAAISIRLPEAGARVVKWLNDPDARVREAAAEVLGVLPHPGSAAALGRVLEDPEPSVRAAAAGALGNSGSSDASLFLLGHLDDSDPEVRHAVIAALEDLGDPRAVVPLIGRIQEQRAPLRRQAVVALGTLGDGRAASALIVALGDPDSTVRAAAATALGKLQASDAVWSLGALLETESDPDVQGALLGALGAMGSTSGADAILRAASRRHWTGARIEEALGSAGESALPSLEHCVFQTVHLGTVQSCVTALGVIGGQHAREILLRTLREGLAEVPRTLGALARAGDTTTLPAVLEYLSSPNPAERRAAIDAADRLLDPDRRLGLAVEPIVQALDRAQSTRLEQAALIGLLGRTGSPRAVPALLPIATSGDEYLRATALEAIGQLGPAGADPVLLAALDAPLFPTRWTAAIALRRVGSRASLEPLLGLLEQAGGRRSETLAVALAGPLSDAPSEAQLERAVAVFAAGSGAVKDALIDAFGAVPGARGTKLLLGLLPGSAKATRAKVAEALAGHLDAREALLQLGSDSDAAVRANAIWSLSAAATSDDVPSLANWIADPDVAVAANAVAALARSSQRLHIDASAALCGSLTDSRSYVLVNALVGLRLTHATCTAANAPAWLLQHHPSDEVRSAAARLLREQSTTTRDAQHALGRCARKDVSGRVAAECKAPSSPIGVPLEPTVTVSVLVVPEGSSTPATRAPFAMVRSDGLIRSGTSDRRGSVSETAAPRGPLRLAVPAVFSD
jgi:HEAT repeat protein